MIDKPDVEFYQWINLHHFIPRKLHILRSIRWYVIMLIMYAKGNEQHCNFLLECLIRLNIKTFFVVHGIYKGSLSHRQNVKFNYKTFYIIITRAQWDKTLTNFEEFI